MTVTTLGSVAGSCARQSPTCRSIHFSVRALRVGGGAATAVVVLAGVLAAIVDVGFVDVRSDLGLFVAQPDSSANNASGVAKPLRHRRRILSSDRTRGRVGKPLEMTGGVARRLIDHPVVGVRTMRGPVAAVGTDRVIGSAQLKRLGLIQRADHNLRLADGIHEPV